MATGAPSSAVLNGSSVEKGQEEEQATPASTIGSSTTTNNTSGSQEGAPTEQGGNPTVVPQPVLIDLTDCPDSPEAPTAKKEPMSQQRNHVRMIRRNPVQRNPNETPEVVIDLTGDSTDDEEDIYSGFIESSNTSAAPAPAETPINPMDYYLDD